MQLTRSANQYIYTQSGQIIDPLRPDASSIILEDIFIGLSKIYRYNGQSHITVLRHSLAVHSLLDEVFDCKSRLGLMHDASEAYVQDITTANKQFLSLRWGDTNERFEALIFEKFLQPQEMMAINLVNTIDKRVVEYEMTRCLGDAMWPLAKSNDIFGDYNKIASFYKWDLEESYLIEKALEIMK